MELVSLESAEEAQQFADYLRLGNLLLSFSIYSVQIKRSLNLDKCH